MLVTILAQARLSPSMILLRGLLRSLHQAQVPWQTKAETLDPQPLTGRCNGCRMRWRCRRAISRGRWRRRTAARRWR